MKRKELTLNELRDSQLLFDKEPPAFGYFIILVVGALLIAALCWSINTPKIYMIQAQGVVTNKESNYVMCAYTGKIENCHLEEGMVVKEGDTLFTIKSTDYDLQEKQLKESKKTYETTVKQYEKLVKSIKDDTNYFTQSSEDDFYYNAYNSYKNETAQYTFDSSSYSAYGYTEEQIQNEMSKNQAKITSIYYSALQNAESGIKEAKTQIDNINAQLSAIKEGQEEYAVKANSSGVLHLLQSYKNGMVVQTTTAVASITPENSSGYIETYVSTADKARMHQGDQVSIVVDGLSQNVYGTIDGTVELIDSNVTTQQSDSGNTSQAFKVLIKMNETYIVSNNGEKVDITNGMSATARIRYDKVSYFNYFLEKLGFKTRS